MDDRLTGSAGERHALAHLAERARTVTRAATTGLVEPYPRVQQYGQRAPGGGAPPLRRRERGPGVDQRPRATWTAPLPPLPPLVPIGVRLLVRGAARQAYVRRLRVAHASAWQPSTQRRSRVTATSRSARPRLRPERPALPHAASRAHRELTDRPCSPAQPVPKPVRRKPWHHPPTSPAPSLTCQSPTTARPRPPTFPVACLRRAAGRLAARRLHRGIPLLPRV